MNAAHLGRAGHLAASPGKQLELVDKARRKGLRPRQLRRALPIKKAPYHSALIHCHKTDGSLMKP
jgi:hypothetical protein